jgi:hypothetical protein
VLTLVRMPSGQHATARRSPGRLTAGGSDGNERLTAITGAILIVPLAVIGVTLLRLRPLLSVHLFVGLLLIGPILLKLGSTGYRFVRYYTRNPTYLRKGPPPTYLRLIAPLVVLTTVIVFASGVALLLIGPSSRGTLLPVHKISFIVWVALTAIHVLGHLPEVQRALFGGRDLRGAVFAGATGTKHDAREGRAGRALSLAAALVGGLVLAVLLIPQFEPWLNAQPSFLHH